MYELPTFPCFYPLLTTSKSIDFTGFLTNLLSSKFLLYNLHLLLSTIFFHPLYYIYYKYKIWSDNIMAKLPQISEVKFEVMQIIW